jgi:hypothetical protein
MFNSKFCLVVSVLFSGTLAIGSISQARAIKLSQESSAALDKRMSEEARTPPRGSSFYYRLTRGIIPHWETTVDAAGLHTLLNQNPKAYTLFKPDFDKMDRNVMAKLFALENQADLQRVLKCHVVPSKILLKNLPSLKEVTFAAMEKGCSFKILVEHVKFKETTRYDNATGIVYNPPRVRILNRTTLSINNYRRPGAGTVDTDRIPKGRGNYVQYDDISDVMMPPDLARKYAATPSERPLTD